MTDITCSGWSPSRMIEPLPNCRSICVSAVSTARHFSVDFTLDMSSPFSLVAELALPTPCALGFVGLMLDA